MTNNGPGPIAAASLGQDPAVQVDDLVVDRGGSRILNQVKLSVSRGEVVAIQGESGAGKTTLLAALCGLIKPTSGLVNILGRDISTTTDAKRSAVRLRDFGLVFQGDELLPELSLVENITLPLRLLHGRVTGSDVASVDELSHALGIQPVMDRLPTSVSGGQLQRAAIARALVHRPSVVLADEPTAALDRATATSAMNSLITVARQHNAAVVIVTHSKDIAAHCDRRVELDAGRLSDVDSASLGRLDVGAIEL